MSQIAHNKKLKALKALKKQDLPRATKLLEQACKANSRDAEAWYLLGAIHGQAGNIPAVIACGNKVLELQPDHANAHSILGNALATLGRYAAAKEHYRQALQSNPNDPEILSNLGSALYMAGDYDAAAEELSKATQLRPDHAYAHNSLGNVYIAQNKITEALHHLKRACALDPTMVEAQHNLGLLYIDRLRRFEDANACFRQILRLIPDDINAHQNLINSLCLLGRLDEANDAARNALRYRPDNPALLASTAQVYERKGRHDQAFELVDGLISKQQATPMAISIALKMCRHYDYCDKATKSAENLLTGHELDPGAQQMIHYDLGATYDKLENYESAFLHYQKANAIDAPPFRLESFKDAINALVDAYSIELNGLQRSACTSTRPIFIIGMPRSGTSLTEQILSSHPDIHGAGELMDIYTLRETLHYNGAHYPHAVELLDQDRLNQLADQYLKKLETLSPNTRYVTDKLPHNFLSLGLIAQLFPKASVIHCVRDPRDTCLSIYFQSFGWKHPYATDLKNLGKYYRQYCRLMQHWESVINLPMMTVHYEDMVNNQEPTSRRLVNFIGLEWDDNCLQFHKTKRTVATASYNQVRQPMYTKSMARWRHYEKHIGPLVEALGDLID